MTLFFSSKRKKEHLDIIRTKNTSSKSSSGLENIILIPKTLPELDFAEIDTSTSFLGKKISAPLLISSMTGGTEEALKINQCLARAAEKYNIPLAIGSQKAMILHPELARTYMVQSVAPNAIIVGNIGIDYLLSREYDIKKLKNACKQIGARALYIHINPLQELAQPEGSKNFKGALDKITEVCNKIGIPVLAKEVGDGFNPKTAKKLEKAGIRMIDVAGSGGTSWSAVEGYRGSTIGESFRNWGLSTTLSLISTKKHVKIPVIASGGIRDGQDIAKSIALGADLAGVAQPFALAAFKGDKALDQAIEKMILELKVTMMLVGAKNISDLKKSKYLMRSGLNSLLEQLG